MPNESPQYLIEDEELRNLVVEFVKTMLTREQREILSRVILLPLE